MAFLATSLITRSLVSRNPDVFSTLQDICTYFHDKYTDVTNLFIKLFVVVYVRNCLLKTAFTCFSRCPVSCYKFPSQWFLVQVSQNLSRHDVIFQLLFTTSCLTRAFLYKYIGPIRTVQICLRTFFTCRKQCP